MRATRRDVELWVNPSAWDDPVQADQVIDAILAADSDDEAVWVTIAGGDPPLIMAAADRDFDAADAAAARPEMGEDSNRSADAQAALSRAEITIELGRLGAARAAAGRGLQAATEALKPAVAAAVAARIPEETIAALAGVSRMTVRKWAGK